MKKIYYKLIGLSIVLTSISILIGIIFHSLTYSYKWFNAIFIFSSNLSHILNRLLDISVYPNDIVQIVVFSFYFLIYYGLISLLAHKITTKYNINIKNALIIGIVSLIIIFIIGEIFFVDVVFDGPEIRHGIDLLLLGIGGVPILSVLIEVIKNRVFINKKI